MENSKRISLVTLMGLPGSGKTTLCQELIKLTTSLLCKSESANEVPSIILLEFDALIPIHIQSHFVQHPTLAKTLRTNFLKLIDQFVKTLQDGKAEHQEPDRFSKVLEEEADLLDTNEELLPKGSLVAAFLSQVFRTTQTIDNSTSSKSSSQDYILLIDDNNYYKSMRYDIYQISKSNSIGFCVLYPKTTVAVCQERNLQRHEDNRVPSGVIGEMNKKLEEPNPLQNAADVLCLQISDVLDTSTHKLIYDTLIYTLANPVRSTSLNGSVEASNRDRRICAENEVHQADLILRKWIHTELALISFGTARQELKSKGKQLQEKKSVVLQGLRSGEMQVTSSPGDEFEFRKEILVLVRQVQLNQDT